MKLRSLTRLGEHRRYPTQITLNDQQLHDRLNAYQDSRGVIGADLEFFAYGAPKLDGLVEQSALDQLEFFAQTGSGGLYGVWALPDGRRPVIYFCDEGVDTCLVTASIEDFAKLIAIGYQRFPCFPDRPADPDPDPSINQSVDEFGTYVSGLLDCEIPTVGGALAIHHDSSYPDIVQFFDDAWIPRPQDSPTPILGERLGHWLGTKLSRLIGRDP